MLCEKCRKNEATFYYHENVNGQTKTYRLCADCANAMTESGELKEFDTDKYFEEFDSFFKDPFKSMDNLLSGFFGGERSALASGADKADEKSCPGCGMTLREFAANGGIGCPRCYEAFEAELAPTVSRVHGRGSHVGRAPSKFRDRIDRKRRIESLEAEQREAIKNENYERAAEIRDELKKLRELNAAAELTPNDAHDVAEVPAENARTTESTNEEQS